MYDFHTHTHFSGDSTADPEQMILSAIDKKLSGIAVTDHMDYDYPHLDPQFELDVDKHFCTLDSLKQHYQSQIAVFIGLEIGYQPCCESKAKNAVLGKPYDFILGSIHTLEGADLYYGDFFKNKSPETALEIYFGALKHMVESFHAFDVIGHLDLPRRYHKPINQLPIEAYEKYLTPLLQTIIERDKGIEFNTSGYRYGDHGPYPHFEIARLYYQLGGRKITLGSDAHIPDDVGHRFKETADTLKKIGFHKAYYYNRRQAISYPL